MEETEVPESAQNSDPEILIPGNETLNRRKLKRKSVQKPQQSRVESMAHLTNMTTDLDPVEIEAMIATSEARSEANTGEEDESLVQQQPRSSRKTRDHNLLTEAEIKFQFHRYDLFLVSCSF